MSERDYMEEIGTRVENFTEHRKPGVMDVVSGWFRKPRENLDPLYSWAKSHGGVFGDRPYRWGTNPGMEEQYGAMGGQVGEEITEGALANAIDLLLRTEDPDYHYSSQRVQ